MHLMCLPRSPGTASACEPQSLDDVQVLDDSGTTIDKLELPPYYQTLARDSYDNCLAYLDERLGELFDELAATRRARSDPGDRDVRSWRRAGGARPVRPRREPLPHRDPRAAPDRAARRAGGPRGRERDRQPPQFAGDDRRARRPGGRVALSRAVAGRPVAEILVRPPAGRGRRRDLRATARIRPIRIRADRRPSGARWSPWPKAISSTSATRAMGPRNYSMNATIAASYAIGPGSRRMQPVLNRLRRRVDQWKKRP